MLHENRRSRRNINIIPEKKLGIYNIQQLHKTAAIAEISLKRKFIFGFAQIAPFLHVIKRMLFMLVLPSSRSFIMSPLSSVKSGAMLLIIFIAIIPPRMVK